jgi:glyoxylase-like metal-dependent hydrolase (beta-lactamase superfamily II)
VAEPREVAQRVDEVVPGVWAWSVRDERIGGSRTFAHAIEDAAGAILIDPLPLAPEALARLGQVQAIVLTTSSHQRSSWRLRRELGAPVWAPRGSQEMDERPDHEYWEGNSLPGGLRAIFTPGAGTRQHSLLRERVLFIPDLLLREDGGELEVIPAEYAHDEPQARETLRAILEEEFDVLCLAHGAPVTDDAKGAIRAALER